MPSPLIPRQVRSHRIDGNLVLLEMEISINLTSLTIEAVIHKRKKLLRDLCEQIQVRVAETARIRQSERPRADSSHIRRECTSHCQRLLS